MKQFIIAAIMLATSTYTHAQPYLDSFDINTSLSNHSSPANLTAAGNTLYFTANDSLHGNEIWAMFGNAKAPTRLTDITPGPGTNILANAQSFNIAGGTIFFPARDTVHGVELWFLNSGGGTAMVKDIYPGALQSGVSYLYSYNEKLYFTANDKEHGSELWMHDPVGNVTERLTDINPDSTHSQPRYYIAFKNKLYFQAYTAKTGSELYEYNFADKSTRLIADLRDTNQSSSPINFTIFDNKLYFMAIDNDHGFELWSYDGSTPPVRITDLNPGAGSGISTSCNMAVFNGELYFAGFHNTRYELSKYNPGNGQVSLVHIINPDNNANIFSLTVYKNALYFIANDGMNGTKGTEIWKYTGSGAPVAVTDISPAKMYNQVNSLTATANALYFSARGLKIGMELFRYSESKLGIENVGFNGKANIYPNPTQDIAHLEIILQESMSLSVTLTDINGRTVFSKPNTLYSIATHNIDVPMQHLPQGTYVYSIKNADGRLMESGKVQKL